MRYPQVPFIHTYAQHGTLAVVQSANPPAAHCKKKQDIVCYSLQVRPAKSQRHS